MLRVEFKTIELIKRYPLAISRGIQASSHNLFVSVSDGEHTGLGELSPSTTKNWTAATGQLQIEKFVHENQPLLGAPSPHEVWQQMREASMDPPAMAAFDMALWDLLAKQAGLPLYRLLGLPKKSVPTSVTAGLNPPELTRERVPEILSRTGARALKIKLGSPDGRGHDREHFLAAAAAAKPFAVKLRVDANGGWTVPEAKEMMKWLAGQGVEYVEQPLPQGQEEDLPELFEDRPLPIFVDESCGFSSEVPTLALPFVLWMARNKAISLEHSKKLFRAIDGINLKLMKCGGITEALRIVATVRAFGLKTMIGCMSESSVAIAAGASMGALFDYIDLDSHLNLNPDPAAGAPILEGVITPTDHPGHGGHLLHA